VISVDNVEIAWAAYFYWSRIVKFLQVCNFKLMANNHRLRRLSDELYFWLRKNGKQIKELWLGIIYEHGLCFYWDNLFQNPGQSLL